MLFRLWDPCGSYVAGRTVSSGVEERRASKSPQRTLGEKKKGERERRGRETRSPPKDRGKRKEEEEKNLRLPFEGLFFFFSGEVTPGNDQGFLLALCKAFPAVLSL